MLHSNHCLAKKLRTNRSYVIRKRGLSEHQRQFLESFNSPYFFKKSTAWQWGLRQPSCFSQEHLEIGFGNGSLLHQRALAHPNFLFWGIEVYPLGLFQCIQRVESSQINNIRILEGDALLCLKPTYFIERFSSIWICFPDPWHKTRQKKRRLLSLEFLNFLTRCLKIKGQLWIRTDNQDYANNIQDNLSQISCLQRVSVTQLRDQTRLSPSKYEEKAIRAEKKIASFLSEKI